MPNIFRTGRPTNFKIGIQTEHEYPHHRQAPWAPRSTRPTNAETGSVQYPHHLKPDYCDSKNVWARLITGCLQTVFVWMPIRLSLYGWERSNSQLLVQCQTVNTGTASLPVATEVTCLGVVFDSELTFSKHVKSVVRCCFYHLRQLRTVSKSLTTESVAQALSFRRSLQVDWITATASSIRSVLPIYKHCSQSWTQPLDLSCRNGNTTTSLWHYVMIYTGCLSGSE